MSKWRKVWRLSWPERWLLLRAVFVLPAVAALVRLGGVRRCQTILARLSPVGKKSHYVEGESAEALARTVARMVRAASAHGPFHANCLQQSLTLWCLLRRRGIMGDLRIGTRKEEGRFEAHAWIEFAGVALNESRDVHARFTAFDQPLPPPEARLS